MIKAYADLWKNIFNFTGQTTRKYFWLGIASQIITMYIITVPLALVSTVISVDPIALSVVYIIIYNIPCISLVFRRGNDAGINLFDLILIVFCIPAAGFFIIGFIASKQPNTKKHILPFTIKTFIIGIAAFIYSGILSLFLHGVPDAYAPVTYTALAIMTLSIIVGYISTLKK